MRVSVRAGILVTGTEVLTGRVTDRNGPWLSQQLGAVGVEVSHLMVVGDRAEDLESALGFLAGAGMDLIVTSGGLGPTADDITAEIVARFTGRQLVLDEAMEVRIAEIVAGFARRMKFDPAGLREGTRKQAMVPVGSIPLDPAGTAPGLVVPGDAVVVVLPGPPRELQAMWPAAVAAAPVAETLARAERIATRSMKMFGIPESTLAKSLREIEGDGVELGRIEVTTCLRRGAELEIDVRYREAEAELLEQLFDGLRDRHSQHIYTEAGESIDDIVAALLAGHRIAVGESCSGGKLAARLTDRPGSSAYFAGGVVAYSNEAKTELLGVSESLLSEHGAVSNEVAEALAEGAMSRFGADLGIGVTGVAGPGGGGEAKPVGYVCICVKSADGRFLARDPQLPGNRDDVRDRSVSVAMHMLRRLLLGEDLPF